MKTGANELLDVMHKIEKECEGVGGSFGHTNQKTVTGVARDIGSDFSLYDEYLGERWAEVANGLQSVSQKLEENLRVVRIEVEKYATGSSEIENRLQKVVNEVFEEGQNVLKELGLTS